MKISTSRSPQVPRPASAQHLRFIPKPSWQQVTRQILTLTNQISEIRASESHSCRCKTNKSQCRHSSKNRSSKSTGSKNCFRKKDKPQCSQIMTEVSTEVWSHDEKKRLYPTHLIQAGRQAAKEVHVLKVRNAQLEKEKDSLAKKLMLNEIEKKAMAKVIEKYHQKEIQSQKKSEQNAIEAMQRTPMASQYCSKVVTRDCSSLYSQSASPMRPRIQIERNKKKDNHKLNEMSNKIDIIRLQREFQSLMSKSRLQKNRARRRGIWGQMKQTAAKIKLLKQS